MQIVEMNEALLTQVAEIEAECFSVPWSREMLLPELSNPLARFFVAVENGKAVGYCGMHNVAGECSITNVAVLPQWRRKGIACALVETLDGRARAENADFITLEVRESNLPAISLYEKHGFERVGVRKGYYTHPTENAILMTKFYSERSI